MNKNVFNYLNGKKQELTSYIKTKSEQAGTYISEHAQDIKKGLVKGTATALTTAMLLGGVAGCENLPQITPTQPTDSSDVATFPFDYEDTETRPMDEIVETGITADDVLGAYDEFARNIISYYYPEVKDMLKNKHCNFVNITPSTGSKSDPSTNTSYLTDLPIYIRQNYFNRRQTWLPGSQSLTPLENVYGINLRIATDLFGFEELYIITTLGIAESDFDNMMKSYGKTSFRITKEQMDRYPDYYLESFINQRGYDSLTIDRDLISNSNEDQLWALMAVLENSLHPISKGNEPENNLAIPNEINTR